MRIDSDLNVGTISRLQSDPLEKRDGAAMQGGQTPRQGGDHVQLSVRKSAVDQLKQAAESAPDIRQDRVAAIRSRIDEGTYSVSSRAVAEKMLQSIGRTVAGGRG